MTRFQLKLLHETRTMVFCSWRCHLSSLSFRSQLFNQASQLMNNAVGLMPWTPNCFSSLLLHSLVPNSIPVESRKLSCNSLICWACAWEWVLLGQPTPLASWKCRANSAQPLGCRGPGFSFPFQLMPVSWQAMHPLPIHLCDKVLTLLGMSCTNSESVRDPNT